MSHLNDIARISAAQSRSISAENPTGAPGMGGRATDGTGAHYARHLGQTWKVSPSIPIASGQTALLADIEGAGYLRHIWMTTDSKAWRALILRMWWDGEEEPSVEVPLGDFFLNGWCEKALVNSEPIVVAPSGGLNCYWPMPFGSRAKISLENRHDKDVILYFQIDYSLEAVDDDEARFHAQMRRSNPTQYKVPHTILSGVRGRGHYVGTYLAWQSNSCDWWGEGEVKFYLDGDGDFPTICGTGTEDYVGGAYNFEQPKGQYCTYSTPYLGMHQVISPDGLYRSQQRFGMYRFHIPDPIRFERELRVTIQALGIREGERFLPLKDDIASTAFWYQQEPHSPFPALLSDDELFVSQKIDW